MLVHEIELLKRLDHPNILKLYEVFQDEKRIYIITELCTGGELFDEVTIKRQLDELPAAIIIQQIIAGVAYCHRQNVVHRDLKLENIMLDQRKSMNIKLSDFGSAKIFSTQGETRLMDDVRGSAYYIAPEVLLSEYDEKCDIWSIGVILYTLLAGRPPFEGSNELEIVKKVREGHYDLDIPELSKTSREAKDLIMRLLAYEPSERITLDMAMEHRWIKIHDQSEKDRDITIKALAALSQFNPQKKLQEAVITFIVGQLAEKDDMIDLQKAFKVLDQDNDGMLSKEELHQAYITYFGPETATTIVENIFAKADIDGSGEIDYSEWIVATIDKNKLLTEEKLRAAFSLFDKDNSG